jgi:hypothetical protein
VTPAGRRSVAGRSPDSGSTVPLILGLFLIALLVVGGSVAASDAFVQQSQLQDECDGAAVAAASAADLDQGRRQGDPSENFLVLGAVQAAVAQYVERDSARAGIAMRASLATDDVTVTVACVQTRPIAFGAWFGFAHGVEHHATSTSRGRLRQ